LPLAKQGRVLIMGAEGSGKSMVPEVMTLVLYGKGSPRVRKNGLVESSIVNESVGYQGTLAFDSGFGAATRHVSITQAFKHKRMGSRYIITVDGVREEPDTKPQQKKLVKRLAPLSYEEWLGVVYLHQGGIHDLLAGGPTEKRDYLTSVFGLDFYDDLLTQAQEELKALVKKSSTYGDLQQELANLEEEQRTHQETLDEVPGGVAAVEAGVAKLQDRLQKLSNDLGKLEAADDAFDALDDIRQQIEATDVHEQLKHDIDDARDALVDAQEAMDEATSTLTEIEANLRSLFHQKTAYDAAQARVTEAKAALAKTEEVLPSFTTVLDGVPDDSYLEALSTLLQDATSVLGDLNFALADGVKVKKGTSWREAAEDAAQAKTTAKKLAKLVQAHTSECPTCETHLDEKTLAATTKSLWGQADASQKQAVAALRAEVFAVAQWWPRVPVYAGTIGEIADAVDNTVKVRSQYERLTETQANQAAALKKAQDALKALPKPQSPEKLTEKKKAVEAERNEHKTAVKNLTALVSLHKQHASASKLVDGLTHDEVKAQLQAGTIKREKAKASLAEALKIKSTCDQATASLRHLKKRLSFVKEAIQEHAETAVKVQHYEDTLVPFFTALRASKVRSCVSVLEGVLPVYVSAMSSNQYTGAQVKLSVSDDLKDVDLMLRTGEHTPWISAIQASGGQRRRFTMAIIAALREVSPRKANLMFFDEPFADLESEGKLLFVQRLIPTLMERCPDLDSVFVIAHDAEILQAANDSFDSVWQVERDERGSRIELGKRLAMVDGR
jgi:DNA repair exonuclease SbcCD ATPase subunit